MRRRASLFEEDYTKIVHKPPKTIGKQRVSEDEYIRLYNHDSSAEGSENKRSSNVQKEGPDERKQSLFFWSNFYKDKRKPDSTSEQIDNPNAKGLSAPSNPLLLLGDVNVDDTEKINWEAWWIRSPLWRRFSIVMTLVAIILILVQLFAAIYFFTRAFKEKIENPYVCKTENCKYVSGWIKESIDDNISPCDNFYEFVCNRYTDKDDGIRGNSWRLNAATLEFGKQNVLAEVLRNFKNNTIHDQHIQYYKKCLDSELRNQFGLDFFFKLSKELYGDLTKIDADPITLEEMAVKVIKIIGDFGFFDFEFNAYPYILMDRFVWIDGIKAESIPKILGFVFPELVKPGVPVGLVDEISKGIFGIKETLNIIANKSTYAKSEADVCDSSLNNSPFNIKKVLDLYTEDDTITFTFISEKDKFFYYGLTHCWNMASVPSNRQKSTFGNQTVFWLLRILLNALKEVSVVEFKQLEPYLDIFPAYFKETRVRKKSLEYQCYHSMSRNLGYIISHRYFEQLGLDSTEFSTKIEAFFRRNVKLLSKFWNDTKMFPHISSNQREEGMKLLTGADPFFFMSNVPTPHDILTEDVLSLNFSSDHLQNSFYGKAFTLRQAKKWWKRHDDKRHILMWNTHTFNLEMGYFTVAPTEKINSIFTPISYYLEPYDSDILSIRNGGATVVCVREMLVALYDYVWKENMKLKYPNWKSSSDGSNKSCTIYRYNSTLKLATMSQSTFRRVFEQRADFFYDVMALKVAHYDSADRDIINNTPYWKLSKRSRTWALSKMLIGFENYSEEQLFYLAVVRHYCRVKPSSFKPSYEKYVSGILSTLMQMSEFADAWSCPPATAMNPLEKCF